MPAVRLETEVAAPAERVFDLARDVDLHVRSLRRSGERAVAGVTSGLIGPGEEVTWRARHLGLPFRLTSRITAFDRPHRFRDSQVRGPFARCDHDHLFEERAGVTVMTDVFEYELPLGPLGRVADRLLVRRRLERLLRERAHAVKRAAEADAELH